MSFKTSQFYINIQVVILLGVVSFFVNFLPVQTEDFSCSTSAGFQDNAAEYVTVQYRTRRKGRRIITDVTNAEILWQPQGMLKKPSCYNIATAELYMRVPGSGQWILSEFDQKPSGKSIKWTVDVKPCLAYEFKIRLASNDIQGEDHFFEIPHKLGPASQEQIDESKYTPEPPTGFNVVNVQSDSATIEWEASDCATGYEVSYVEAGKDISELSEGLSLTDLFTDLTGLKPCTKYETTVSAILDDQYGDLSTEFATKPKYNAASDLNVEIIEDLTAVTISWEAWQGVSCIDQYLVTVCEVKEDKVEQGNSISDFTEKGKCKEPEIIKKIAASPYVGHTVEGLKPCTDYILKLRPLFPKTDLEQKEMPFRTLSMDASKMSISGIEGKVVSSGSIMVEWTPLICAAKYKVWEKEINDDGGEKFLLVAETEYSGENKATVGNIAPCTKYQFAISAVWADGNETEKTVGPELISDLDANEPFEVPNLHVINGDNKFDINWRHAECIESYMVKTCPTGSTSSDTDCIQATIPPGETVDDTTIHYTAAGLQPCTEYELHITPIISNKGPFQGNPTLAKTTDGTPQAPQEFSVEWKSGAVLKWAPVQCATGYKVYYKISEGFESASVEDTTELEKKLVDAVACQTYTYSVASAVGEQKSITTDWKKLDIPPYIEEQPKVQIFKDRDNDNVTLKITPPRGNELCSIDKYEVKYSSDGDTFEEETILTEELGDDGEIVLSFDGASLPSAVLKTRVHYAAQNEWSAETSTTVLQPYYNMAPTTNTTTDSIFSSIARTINENDTTITEEPNFEPTELPLIPIIVAVVVVLLVIIGIALLIKCRKKRHPDTEGAENGTTKHHHNLAVSDEETQKLNGVSA